jgi:cysteine-rich repeat protein
MNGLWKKNWAAAAVVASTFVWAGCSDPSAPEPVVDSTTVDGAVPDVSAEAPSVADPALSAEAGPEQWRGDGHTVRVPFSGMFDPETNRMDFFFEESEVPADVGDGLRTADQALYCTNAINIVADGNSGSGPRNSAELENDAVFTYGDCDPATFPNGDPGPSYGNLIETDGALCADVSFRSFYRYPFSGVYAEIYEITPLENRAYTYADRALDGLGTGAQPPEGAGAPVDSLGGLFYYGDIEADDPERRLNEGWDNAVTVRWVFRYPIADAPIYFQGTMYAQFYESCNTLDDDCDGRIDEGAGCFDAGVFCVDDSDCGTDQFGGQLSCLENEFTGERTCGGELLPEDCTGTVDTNNDGLIGCQDPTCAEDPACPNFSCANGNLEDGVSTIETDSLRSGEVFSGNISRYTLDGGQEQCGSLFPGSDRSFLWTAPADGIYTISSFGSTYDTALIVVEGECPVDLGAAFANGEASCVDDSVGTASEESFLLTATAGTNYLLILDSALPSTSPLGRGDWALSIFKTAVCGDGFTDPVDRFGNLLEDCDSSGSDSADCNADCSARVCGDGIINAAVENCEDGNTTSGDGCDSDCVTETGYACDETGCFEACGDGVVLAGGTEACDNGTATAGTGCSVDCLAVETGYACAPAGGPCEEICGDGITVGDEVCDASGGPGCVDECRTVASGWECPEEGGACTDINECDRETDNCSDFGTCSNVDGSFECACNSGYAGDGVLCANINECDADPCDTDAVCADSDGSFTCTCNSGYSGDGFICADINECDTDNGGCDSLTTCLNRPGGFDCSACPDGYVGDGLAGCTALDCDDPGAPVFGAQDGTYASFVLGTTVDFVCDTGYFASAGDASRTCVPDGAGGVEFDGVMITCSPSPCTDPTPPANSSNSGPASGYVFGDVAAFDCDPGYELAGAATLTTSCQSDGTFSAPTGSCERKDCGSLTDVTNGSVSFTTTTFESTASYACETGYNLVGDASRTCGTDGTWSGAAPACEIQSCGTPTPPEGALVTGGPYDFTYGDVVAFACQTGRQAQGVLETTCQADGTYAAVSGSCPFVDCGVLPAPSNGTVSAGDTIYATTRTLGCDTGYVVSGSTERTCQASGDWSGTPTACTIYDCGGSYPVPLNGSAANVTGTTYGETVTYACNSGYERIAGDPTATCSESGWVGTVPTCERVVCPSVTSGPQAPANGSVASGGNGPHSFEDVVTFSCDAGYDHTGGDLSRTCQANATWSGSVPTCTRISCTDPGVPSGGSVSSGNAGAAPYDFGSIITYACDAGYDPVGAQTLTCGSGDSSTGRWDFAAPSCAPGDCGPLPPVANSSLSPANPSTLLNSSVTYTCDTGYEHTAGNLGRTCGTDRLWSGTSPTCSPVSCGALATPAGQVVTSGASNNTFGETVSYACAPGYELPGGASAGDLSRSCQANRSWSPASASCQRVDCGSLGTPANGSRTGATTTYESTMAFSCDAGYNLAGSASRTCQTDGTWSGTQPTCDARDCGALPNPTNGAVNTSGGTTYPSTASYSCNAGYVRSGSATRACQTSGTWSGSAPTCQPVSCGTLPSPANGSVSLTGTTYQNTAGYSCNTGYNLSGGASRTCLSSGTWSGSAPTCQIASCGNPGAVTNGSVSASGTTYLSTATHSCRAGYTVRAGTSTSQTCQANGGWAWSGSPLICDIRNCGTPPNISNGSRTFSATTYQATAAYSCNSGYVRSGPSAATCQANGAWSTRPTCNPVNCGTTMPSNPPNASYTSRTGTTLGQLGTYTCNSGYSANGVAGGPSTTSSTCQSSGAWSTPSGCQPVSCGNRPNGGSNNQTPTATGSTFGAVATYLCTSGFTLNGATSGGTSYTRTCGSTGAWSGSARNCAPVNCGSLANPSNGSVSAPVTTYTGTATYSCNTGYQLSAGATRTCQSNGAWSGGAPTCNIVTCPSLSSPTNGTVNNGSNNYGSTRTYTCNSGFERTGASSTTCRVNGTWSNSAPTCRQINECTEGINSNTGTPACTATGNYCVDTTGSWQCRCNTGDGWYGSTRTGTNASCAPSCGDGRQRGTEQCDLGGLSASGPHYSSVPRLESVVNNACVACTRRNMVPSSTSCSDNVNNDGTQGTDCFDPDCGGMGSCPNWSCRNTSTGTFSSNPTPVSEYITNTPAGTVNQTVFNRNFSLAGRPRAYSQSGSGATNAIMWRAPASGTYDFSTCDSGFDTVLSLWSGTNTNACGRASTSSGRIVNNDDDGPACSSDRASIRYNVTAGTTYIISMGSYYTSNNSSTLNLKIIRRGCGSGERADCSNVCRPGNTYGGSCDTYFSCAALNYDNGACRCSSSSPSGGNQSTSPVNPGQYINYSCNAGYNASGSSSRYCSSNGTLTGSTFSCSINDTFCPSYPGAGYYAVRGSISNGRRINSRIGYYCSAGGTVYSGSTTRTCQSNRAWSGSALNCHVCPLPPVGARAQTTSVSGHRTIGSVAYFGCTNGNRYRSGNSPRYCQSNRLWSGSNYTCESSGGCAAVTTESAPASQHGLVWLLGVAGLLYLKPRRRAMK